MESKPGAPDMHQRTLGQTLSRIAVQAVPETIDLWPGISGELAAREPQRRPRSGVRAGRARAAFVVASAMALALVGVVVVQSLLPGQLTTTQAADLARNDPQVAAILRGDVSIATVTSVVDDVATVVVTGTHGQAVTVSVDLRDRIVTKVEQGPQLSPELTAKAITLVRTDPRTSALLDRGATTGRITPIFVTAETVDPSSGAHAQVNQTWAQVPLDLDGQEWIAAVDLVQGKVDQLLDPQGTQVPTP
jgi:hypothetical protein